MIRSTIHRTSWAAVILPMFISSVSAKPPFLSGSYKSSIGDKLEVVISGSTELITQYYLVRQSGCNTIFVVAKFPIPDHYAGSTIVTTDITPNPFTLYCGGATLIIHLTGLAESFTHTRGTELNEIAGAYAGSRTETFSPSNSVLPTRK